MQRILKSWRRTAGVILLATTVCLVAAWITSASQPSFRFEFTSDSTVALFASAHSGLFWGTYRAVDGHRFSWSDGDSLSTEFKRIAFLKVLEVSRSQGFAFSVHTPTLSHNVLKPEFDPGMSLYVWRIPYWVLILPLAGVSAWLLLRERVKTRDELSHVDPRAAVA